MVEVTLYVLDRGKREAVRPELEALELVTPTLVW